jgi:hypothetical protein
VKVPAKKPLKKKPVEEDPFAIPDFLRVENRPKANTTKKKKQDEPDAPPPPPAPTPTELAMAALSPPAFKEFIEKAVRRGHFNPDWLVVGGTRGRGEADVEAVLRQFRIKYDEEQDKAVQRKLRFAEMAERRPKKVSPFAGLVKLSDILKKMGDKAPSRGAAKKAIDAANLDHTMYHFPDVVLTLAKVDAVLRNYKPPAKVRGGAKVVFAPSAVISWTKGKKNPKKAGSGAHDRWKLLMDHDKKTVAQFLSAEGNPVTLKNAIAGGFASLTGDNNGTQDGQTSGEVQQQEGAEVRRQAKGAEKVVPGKRGGRKHAKGKSKRAKHKRS